MIAVPGAAAPVARRLSRLGVTARLPIFQPIHITLGLDGFPGTAHAFRHGLSVPLYPALTSREEALVIRGLQRVLA